MTSPPQAIPDPPNYDVPTAPPAGSITLTHKRITEVLTYLVEHNGRVANPNNRRLAERTVLSASSLSILLRSMAAKGYIGRTVTPDVRQLWLREPGLKWIQKHGSEAFEEDGQPDRITPLNEAPLTAAGSAATAILQIATQVQEQMGQIARIAQGLIDEQTTMTTEYDKLRHQQAALGDVIVGAAKRVEEIMAGQADRHHADEAPGS